MHAPSPSLRQSSSRSGYTSMLDRGTDVAGNNRRLSAGYFSFGPVPDPVLRVASGPHASTSGGAVSEQGRALPPPRVGRGCFNTWAAARYLAVTCSHANRTAEVVAATVYPAPGKR